MQYLDTNGSDLSAVEKTFRLPASVEAPVKKGDIIGEAVYTLNGKTIGTVSIRADADVERSDYGFYLQQAARRLFL